MYFNLLKEWCDTLISLQVTEIKNKEIYGGIMCPSCARIHGRCGDAIYPMLFLADKTGEQKYLECAKLLFLWTENMTRPDGSYYNDTNSDWKGITVFAMIQLGEALYYHGDLLDPETKNLWMERFKISTEFLYHNIDSIGGNINYPVTCAAAMAVAARLLKEDKYSQKGRQLAHSVLNFITPDGLLFGEGKPNDGVSPKGCRPIDLGYNVEESLPGLVTYALLEDDKEILEVVINLMTTQIEFMLPDGAWDNSWGTRNNKWSYWGSRTSDGCQAGYGLLTKENPIFSEVVYRNTLLLKQCTHNGLLYGGPMYESAGEPPCVHHTICHAKSIATMLEHGNEPQSGMNLPREMAQGIMNFPSIHVSLIGKGHWRTTISDYDYEYSEEGHATGGAITMLWHKDTGPILAGTMTHYNLVEPNNMQIPQHNKEICLTPRIEIEKENVFYRSINDKTASVQYLDGDKIVVKVQGTLVNGTQKGCESYELQYTISDSNFEITGLTSADNARFYIPMISKSSDKVELQNSNLARVTTDSAIIEMDVDKVIKVKTGYEKKMQLGLQSPIKEEFNRIFNPVGGFEAIPFYLDLEKGKPFTLHIGIKQK